MDIKFTSTIKLTPADVEGLLTEALTKAGHIKPGDKVDFRFTTTAKGGDYYDRSMSYEFSGVEVTIVPAEQRTKTGPIPR